MASATVEFKVSAVGRSAAKGLVGVLELERIADAEVPERTVVRDVRAPVGAGARAEPVRIGAGKYLGKLRLPNGEQISELVEIVSGEDLQRVVLGISTAKSKGPARSAQPKSDVSPFTQSRAVDRGGPVSHESAYPTWRGDGVAGVHQRDMPIPRGGLGEAVVSRFKFGLNPLGRQSLFVDIAPAVRNGGLSDYLHSRKQRASAGPVIEAAPVEVLAFEGSSAELRHRLRQRRGSAGHPVAQLIDPSGLQHTSQQLTVVKSSSKSARLRIEAAIDVQERQPAYLVLSRMSAGPDGGDGRKPAMRASLMRVPGPWHDLRRQQKSGVFLEVGGAAGAGSPWRLSVDDPALQSVIDFTQQKDLNGALVVLDMSLKLLMMKVENPYAAAAAGYVLLLTPPSRTPLGWFNWIGNLGNWFDDLPDGLIQHATLLLQRSWKDQAFSLDPRYFPSNERERTRLAADLLLRSLERGLPLYRSGLTLLASNLFILDGSPLLMPEVVAAVARARGYVNALRHLVDTTQAFTTLDISTLAEMDAT